MLYVSKITAMKSVVGWFQFLVGMKSVSNQNLKRAFFFSFKRIKASVGKYFVWTRWLETNRWPDISSTKMGLFGINRELQFRVCSHGEPCTSPHTAREGEHFYKGKKEVGRALVNKQALGFHWESPCQERRWIFLFPIGPCRVWELPLWSPNSI